MIYLLWLSICNSLFSFVDAKYTAHAMQRRLPKQCLHQLKTAFVQVSCDGDKQQRT